MNQLIQLNQKQKSIALQKLVTSSPINVIKKVVSSLMHTHNLKIEERLNKDYEVTGYNIHDTEHLSLDQLKEAEKTIQYSMIPLESFECEKELLKTVACMSKPREENSKDIAFRVKLMAEELSIYPADIYMHVCKHIRNTKTFFPALAEFRNVGDYHFQRRKALLETVQKCIEKKENDKKSIETSA